ncbi:uncharacterized protein SCHCODRAFT_02047683 [Schizophyllum commune H4-8]|uniref:uncharacterized protein n=1 Tax=Schizophyllum commune (strain H4-8 / FGSC 9210) TaxID=578458 RepID=UPI00215FE3BC|nr:uncharacterized protein SCHCODRAFT_02047683 [Schizophyllum commune H4-8]KAI5888182.1 hypothetical protein SCHCODRAFT_02047683 [Schizophyllum commune H4-8]
MALAKDVLSTGVSRGMYGPACPRHRQARPAESPLRNRRPRPLERDTSSFNIIALASGVESSEASQRNNIATRVVRLAEWSFFTCYVLVLPRGCCFVRDMSRCNCRCNCRDFEGKLGSRAGDLRRRLRNQGREDRVDPGMYL